MNKNVQLVLGILKGSGWNPTAGIKTVIQAQLDDHKLSTQAFPLTSSPKFNTEITWKAKKSTIRCYKINRVPVKIECYALDEKNNKKSLGYIIIPLTTAVEGIEVDPKWYKLLGSSKTVYKNPPSILISLHLEPAMTLDQRNQVNGKQIPSLKNGDQLLEDGRFPSVIEKKNLLLQQGVEIRKIHTNGSEGIANLSANKARDVHYRSQASNGTWGEHYKDAYETDSDEVEEAAYDEQDPLDYDSEGCNDGDFSFGQGVIVNAYSIKPSKENHNVDSVQMSVSGVNSHDAREKDVQKERNENNSLELKKSAGSPPKSGNDDEANPLKLMEMRSSSREFLKQLTETSRSLIERNSPRQTSFDRSPSLEKRVLETSNILEDSFNQRKKSRRLANSSVQLPSTSKHVKDIAKNEMKSKMSLNPNVSSTAFLLSQSLDKFSPSAKSEQVVQENSSKQCCHRKLVPVLNQNEGFFSLGPVDEGMEEEFVFSVTVIYAKNLSKVIPEESIPTLQEGFNFCYSLLGFKICTDLFYNVDNPKFLAEKASAVIRSSHEKLSQYFSQHYFLPVHFMNGEQCLGSCSVDMGRLVEIASESEAKIEGVYEIHPDIENSSSKVLKFNSKALVAISLELKKKENTLIASKSKVGTSYNEIFVSDSSDSDEVEFSVTSKRKKGRGSSYKLRDSLKGREDQVHEAVKLHKEVAREKMRMLIEAEAEVEQWKEAKQSQFLKDWSSKEEALQRLLATEWNNKTKIIEEELSHRIKECDELHDKLNVGLRQLSIREEKIKLRENQLSDLDKGLQLERDRIQLMTRRESSQERANAIKEEAVFKELNVEKQKRQQLEQEVSKLREEVRNSQESVSAQTQEIVNLRRKLTLSDNIIGVTKGKEDLEKRVESLSERKQYYKYQWLTAITQLHKLHSSQKKTLTQITSEMKQNSHPEDPTHKMVPTRDFNASEVRLRKFVDERRALRDSGLYSDNHSIMKIINKKINELKG